MNKPASAALTTFVVAEPVMIYASYIANNWANNNYWDLMRGELSCRIFGQENFPCLVNNMLFNVAKFAVDHPYALYIAATVMSLGAAASKFKEHSKKDGKTPSKKTWLTKFRKGPSGSTYDAVASEEKIAPPMPPATAPMDVWDVVREGIKHTPEPQGNPYHDALFGGQETGEPTAKSEDGTNGTRQQHLAAGGTDNAQEAPQQKH